MTLTDTFEKAIKEAMQNDAEIREAFIIEMIAPMTVFEDGKLCLRQDIRLQVKSNRAAVEEYKQTVRNAIDKLLPAHDGSNWMSDCPSAPCCAGKTLKDLKTELDL